MSSDLQYGCVFCKTGKEIVTAKQLEHRFPGIKAVAVQKLRYRRTHGIAHEESVILFPGYVFFSTSMKLSVRDVSPIENIIRVLVNGEGNWQLVGTDKVLAYQFLASGGTIGFSHAYYEGDRIMITDGFLKKYEGNIVRVNHRAKTAQIKVIIDNKEISAWLGFELIRKEKNEKI